MTAELNDPVLVYQMGKVGSRAVFEALAALPVRPPALYHFHELCGLDALEHALVQLGDAPPRALEFVREAQAVRARFVAGDPLHWKVITLVRDPVARNLSSFFYDITRYVPDFYERTPSSVELLEAFLTRPDHDTPLAWFEQQAEPLLSLDVYAAPFPREQGYALLRSERVAWLTLRAEDLAMRIAPAMHALLGIPDFACAKTNAGMDKPYAAAYQRFLSEAQLPAEYLDHVYGSRLARHFYDAGERERMRRRWISR
jgi:hypothetical protein